MYYLNKIVNLPLIKIPEINIMKAMKYKEEADWTDEVTQRFWDNMVTEDVLYFTEAVGLGILKLLKQKIELKGKILDYGCGNGTMMDYLSKENPENEIYGLDFSQTSVETSIRKNAGNKNVKKIINFSEMDKNFEDNSFDVVLLIETIEHLRTDLLTNTLSIINRLLKPGGYIVVTTPFNEDLKAHSIYCPFCDAAHHHMQHVQSFTIERLSTILKNHNFIPKDVNNTDFSYYQDKVAYYKLHTKWWLKNKLGFSKQMPFEKKHLYGIAQKSL